MDVLFLLAGLVSVTYIPVYSQTVSTCAVKVCVTKFICRNALNRTSGVISAVCLNSLVYPSTGNEDRCSNGQPLWVVNSTGGYSEAACGRVVDRTTCPDGYRCVIAPNDAYLLCCPTPAKFGWCPGPASDNIGICIDRCQLDSDCDLDLKCCRNSCGALTCQSPASTISLTCQRLDCLPDMVCIDTPNGSKCVPPRRELTCPFFPAHIDPNCPHRDMCISDANCRKGRLCCTTTCGTRCLNPQ